ncbi:MAG: four helix bundle protein [Chitinophagaceae bacterium]|nr:four helix bundle protein [Chitinophagaceae bacterium]
MATIKRFEDLEIWQIARQLYNKMSVIAVRLRAKREYRFAEQIKSAAGSIMDNIAEGFERDSRLEFVNSLSISKGECGENKSQLYRLFDDHYISESEFNEVFTISDKLSGKIANFIRYLNSSVTRGLKFKDRK